MTVTMYEWLWATRYGTRKHLFYKGPGTGDASLCGVQLQPGGHLRSIQLSDPTCRHCEREFNNLSSGKQTAMKVSDQEHSFCVLGVILERWNEPSKPAAPYKCGEVRLILDRSSAGKGFIRLIVADQNGYLDRSEILSRNYKDATIRRRFESMKELMRPNVDEFEITDAFEPNGDDYS